MATRFLSGLFLLAAVLVTSAPVAAQEPDLWVGTWKLNLERSRFEPAELAPKSQTIKQQATMDGGMKATLDGVDAQGKPTHVSSSTMFDGKPSKIGDAPDKNTTRVYKRVDNRTYEYVESVAGKVTMTVRALVAADGKTRTVTTTGKNAQGQTVNTVAFYDRQ